ncbi:Spy/CpxP family protein refolding chaperone [Zoogloea sp.]|uniref:Spy/CpxP family protein refolding chaperone n=1 Tax=Zoogloea sp. TaxID=49181 RepID=UPI001ACE0878|nr:Spy/CpxP family protein refolding chaperone [Zoogloea sp.]MBN8284878.1 Spy/CpxP family protein refolding chaperone [Zoogloea sp.]
MTRFHHAFPALALSLLLGVAAMPALADMPCGPMGGGMREHRAERMEQHHRKLHEALKLNPEQEVAWKKLIESEHPMGKGRRDAANAGDAASLTTPERAERMLEHMKAHQAAMADHIVVLKAFYAQLSPEQQKIFDDAHRGGRRGMRGKGMGPGQS